VDGFQEKSMLRILIKKAAMCRAMIVLVLCLIAGPALAGEPGGELKMNDISGILQEAQEKAKELPPPVNDHTAAAGGEAAGMLMEKFNAPSYQAVIREEQQRLRESVFKDVLDKSMREGHQPLLEEPAAGAERIYLFVSSSVPLATLRNYAAMINHVRDGRITMVLRGFVGGMKKVGPTLEFIGDILKKDPACDLGKTRCDSFQVTIHVDPEIFQRFQIENVPAMAYLPGGDDQDQAEFLIILGDVSLDFMLERINREAKSGSLRTIIAALRSGKESGE
jgi:conjugal transfer pilus assembly protein TrbC